MRTKKILAFFLVTILVLALSACGMNNDNNRSLTKSYDNNPNTLGMDRNDGTLRNYSIYNRYGGYNPNAYGYNGRYANNNRFNNGYNAYGYNNYDRLSGDTAMENGLYNNRYRTNQFRTNANQDADRMANIADRVNGVASATVVIAGGNAYVGLNLDDNVKSTRANAIEREVYRQVTKMGNRYNVFITSDDDLFGRLRDVGDGMRNGTPVKRFDNDLRDFGTRFRTYQR